jgi:hypothetical protein
MVVLSPDASVHPVVPPEQPASAMADAATPAVISRRRLRAVRFVAKCM